MFNTGAVLILYLLFAPTNIDITGNLFFSDEYLIKHYLDDPETDITVLIEDILDVYTQAGFPFCEIRPTRMIDENNMITITLIVNEGHRIKIADHLFSPNGKTDPGILKRYTRPNKGAFFSSKEIINIERTLLRTNIFTRINDNIVYRDDRYYVLWTLEEQETDFVSAFGTVSEDNYIFSISLHSINLLGTLRTLQFLYEYEKLFTLRFTEPILVAPVSLHGNMALWSYDTMQMFELNGRITAPLWNILDVSIISGIERVSYNISNSDTYTRTSNIFGGAIAVHLECAWLRTEHTASLDYLARDQTRWRELYDGRLEVFYFDIRPHLRYAQTDSFEFFDYFRLGGAQSLRGYFEEEFLVKQAVWVNMEYKRIFLFPLIDVGYIEHEIIYSYGFGIEARSKFAEATLAIAWPKNGTWRDGTVHLTFEKGF